MKKDNGMIIAICLLIVGLLLGGFGGYLYFNSKNSTKNDNKVNNDTVKEEKDDVTIDLDKASIELDNYLAYYIKYRAYDTSVLNTNIVADSSNKLELIDAIFMSNGKATDFRDGQAKYVSISEYQAKYKELYGSLDSYYTDTKNAKVGIYSTNETDTLLPINTVGWNSTWGVVGHEASFKALNYSYDKSSKLSTITGIITYKATDNANSYTRNFTLTYANNGTNNYMTSLVLK